MRQSERLKLLNIIKRRLPGESEIARQNRAISAKVCIVLSESAIYRANNKV